MATCPVYTASVRMNSGFLTPIQSTSAQSCTKIQGTPVGEDDKYFKILCDISCTVMPEITIYDDDTCQSLTASHTISIDGVDTPMIGTYKCGDANAVSPVVGCSDASNTPGECTTLPASTTTAVGVPTAGGTSAASGLKGKVIIGMVAALLAAMSVM